MKKPLLTITILLSVLFSKAQINLDSNLVLYYPFNGNANDSSINQINGILMNGPTFTNDHLGNPNSALLFDGVDDYVLSDSSLTLDSLVEPFTLTAWVRIDDWYLGSWAALVSKSVSSTLQFRIVIKNYYTYWLAPDPACGSLQGSNLPPVNTWFYLTLIQDTNNIRIYVDGTLTDTFICTDFIVTNNYPMTVGNDLHGVTEYFNGAMDELRIYKRALLPQEVGVLSGINSNYFLKQKFVVSPNPSAGAISISLNPFLKEKANLTLTDLYGRKLNEFKIASENTSLKLEQPNGIYFLTISTDTNIYTTKIIIER